MLLMLQTSWHVPCAVTLLLQLQLYSTNVCIHWRLSQLLMLLLLPALLLQNPPVDDADFAGRMSNSLMTWVHCWSSDADLDQLDKGEISS
jgi:hypothetical protein